MFWPNTTKLIFQSPYIWKPRCFRAQKDFPSASVQLGGRHHAEHCRKVFLSILFHLSSLPECLSIISDEWLTGGWWEVILLMLLIVQKTLYRDHFPNDIPHDIFPFIHDNEENVFDQIKHIWCSDLRKGKGGWRNISRFFPSLPPSVTNHKQVDKSKEDRNEKCIFHFHHSSPRSVHQRIRRKNQDVWENLLKAF